MKNTVSFQFLAWCCISIISLVFGGPLGPTLNEIILILSLKSRFRNYIIDEGPKRPGPSGPKLINLASRNLDFVNKINIISFNVGPGRPPKTKLRIAMQNQHHNYKNMVLPLLGLSVCLLFIFLQIPVFFIYI